MSEHTPTPRRLHACNAHDDLVRALRDIADECRAASEISGPPLGKKAWVAVGKIAQKALAKAQS